MTEPITIHYVVTVPLKMSVEEINILRAISTNYAGSKRVMIVRIIRMMHPELSLGAAIRVMKALQEQYHIANIDA